MRARRSATISPPASPPPTFVAIDFETADNGRDSACAVGLVRVEGGRITARVSRLIRPPRAGMDNAWVHGITWERVRREPGFAVVWREISPLFDGARFLAAHNAGFERSVIVASAVAAGLPAPAFDYECTVRLARRTWDLFPTRLPDVCRHLGLRLRHHDALSDAEACAAIVLCAHRDGAVLPTPPPARKRAATSGGAAIAV